MLNEEFIANGLFNFKALHLCSENTKEYRSIDFPLSFFTLETDCDQHEITVFYLMFEIGLMLALSEKS